MDHLKKFKPHKNFHPHLKIFEHFKFLTQKCAVFFVKYRYRYRIGIGRFEKIYIGNLSDRQIPKMGFIGVYPYRPIWKKAYRSYTASERKENKKLAVKFFTNFYRLLNLSCRWTDPMQLKNLRTEQVRSPFFWPFSFDLLRGRTSEATHLLFRVPQITFQIIAAIEIIFSY